MVGGWWEATKHRQFLMKIWGRGTSRRFLLFFAWREREEEQKEVTTQIANMFTMFFNLLNQNRSFSLTKIWGSKAKKIAPNSHKTPCGFCMWLSETYMGTRLPWLQGSLWPSFGNGLGTILAFCRGGGTFLVHCTSLLVFEFILLMVQKSQGQPPGMYKKPCR